MADIRRSRIWISQISFYVIIRLFVFYTCEQSVVPRCVKLFGFFFNEEEAFKNGTVSSRGLDVFMFIFLVDVSVEFSVPLARVHPLISSL